MTDRTDTTDLVDLLRAELSYSTQLIPKLEWAVRQAQAKLAVARGRDPIERAWVNPRIGRTRGLAVDLRRGGMTLQAIADELGVTKQRISRILKAPPP